jgi:hypothetical protein
MFLKCYIVHSHNCIVHVQDSAFVGYVPRAVALNDLDQCHISQCGAQGVNNQLSALYVDSLQGQSTGPFHNIALEKPNEFHFMNDNNFTDCDVYVNTFDNILNYNNDIVAINPSPLSSLNDVDVVVYNCDDGVGTRDVHSSLDISFVNDTCNYNDGEFNFAYLNHLFSCSVKICKLCTYIRSSFISFIHLNIGFIPLGPFVSGNFITLNQGRGVVLSILTFLHIFKFKTNTRVFQISYQKSPRWLPILTFNYLGNYFRDFTTLKSLI